MFTVPFVHVVDGAKNEPLLVHFPYSTGVLFNLQISAANVHDFLCVSRKNHVMKYLLFLLLFISVFDSFGYHEIRELNYAEGTINMYARISMNTSTRKEKGNSSNENI